MRIFKNNIVIVIAIILGISLMSVSIFIQESKNTVKPKITSNKAEEYFYSGKYREAIKEYENIFKNDNNFIWYAKISEVYSVQGDLDNSRKYLSICNKAANKNSELYNNIVFTEFMNKDFIKALQDGEEGLQKYNKDKALIKTVFSVYMANGLVSKAKQLILSYPVNKNSAYDMAEYSRMLMIVGDWNDGFKQLLKAWYVDKDEYKIYDVLAQIAAYDNDTIIQKVQQLSIQNSYEIAYKVWLTKIYSLNSVTANSAMDLFPLINSTMKDTIEYKLMDAEVKKNEGKKQEADKLIVSLIKQYPDSYSVLHNAGWYYLKTGEIDKAEEYCKKSIVKNKQYPDNYGFLMPEILRNQGKSLEGEPFFRTALHKEPYNYNIMLNVAKYYWETNKNTSKAMQYFKLAEIIKPQDTEIKYNIVMLHIENNEIDNAIKELNVCIKIDDSIGKYHRTLGTLYMMDSKTNKLALKEIQYAYHNDEEDLLTLNNAGCYYISVDGNIDKGIYNLQKAFEGLKKVTDKETIKIITDNYGKAKKIYDEYNKGKSNESISVPEFQLFY